MEHLETIGGYPLEARIGAGGHGVVYRSTHPVLQTPVAIKVLHASITRDAAAREPLLREASLMRTLRHSGIVHLYDVGISDDQLFVMELLEHGSLRERLNRGPLTAPQALGMGRALAAALAYAHGEAVLHGDLKPENVLLREDGAPVIADFGLWGSTAPPRGGIAGSPAYMAPEQLLAQPLSAQTDIYALGVLMYEMIAGGPPFGSNTDAAINGHLNAKPPQLRSFDGSVPRDVDATVATMLAKDPADRPRDMAAVVRALDLVLGLNATVELAPTPFNPPPSPSPSRRATASPRPGWSPRSVRLGLALRVLLVLAAMLFVWEGALRSRRQRSADATSSPAPSNGALLNGATTTRLRATELPLTFVAVPIDSEAVLVDPQSVTLGTERWSIGNVGIYQDGTQIRVYGLLRNDQTEARRNVDVRVILRDGGGAELLSEQERGRLFLLGPGNIAPFGVAFAETNLPAESSYSVDFEVRSEPAEQRDVDGRQPVTMSNLAVGRRDGNWAIEGRFSAGKRTIEDPSAYAVFMDAGGKVVGLGYGRLKNNEYTMAPGSEADFGGIAFPMEKQPARVLLLSQGREYLRE